ASMPSRSLLFFAEKDPSPPSQNATQRFGESRDWALLHSRQPDANKGVACKAYGIGRAAPVASRNGTRKEGGAHRAEGRLAKSDRSIRAPGVASLPLRPS